MRKFAIIVGSFFILQAAVLVHVLDAGGPAAERSEVPRAFVMKPETKITINKKGESLLLFANRSTLEEILERIAAEKNVNLTFYCEDPGLKQERAVNLKISGDSIVKVLEQILPGDHRFTLLNREGKAIEPIGEIATVNIYPKNCPKTDSPVRNFITREAPALRKPPEQISFEELGDVIKKGGPNSRRLAADILGIKAEERGIGYAKEALKDENPDVMLAAAGVLRRLGQKYGFDKVASAIYARFRERPYAEFLPVIAQVDKDKIWPIAEGLMEQSTEKEKGIMVRALFLTKDRRAIKYLAEISVRTRENAKQAIYAIGKMGGPEAATVLIGLLREDAERRAFAAQAVHFLPKEDGLEARAEVEKIVRKEGVSDGLLRSLVEVSYLEPLENLLRDPTSKSDMKIRALKAMAASGDQNAIQVMSVSLNDKAPQVRLASAEAMGSLGIEKAIPHLINATGDQDAKVRRAAVKGLSEFPGDDRVVEAVGKAIHDSDQNVRRSAIDALRVLGEPSEKMKRILQECENDQDPYVAEKADSILRNWHLK